MTAPGADRGVITDPRDALAYLTAGRAVATLENSATGRRYTYRVRAPGDRDRQRRGCVRFVDLLTGPQNGSDYAYLGYFLVTSRSLKFYPRLRGTPADAFAWLLRRLGAERPLPAGVQLWHEGRCGRCGRRLTDPESIARGVGPKCSGARS